MLYFVSPLISEGRTAEGHPRLPTDHLSWAAFILFLLICERRAAEGHPRWTTDHLSWAALAHAKQICSPSFSRLVASSDPFEWPLHASTHRHTGTRILDHLLASFIWLVT